MRSRRPAGGTCRPVRRVHLPPCDCHGTPNSLKWRKTKRGRRKLLFKGRNTFVMLKVCYPWDKGLKKMGSSVCLVFLSIAKTTSQSLHACDIPASEHKWGCWRILLMCAPGPLGGGETALGCAFWAWGKSSRMNFEGSACCPSGTTWAGICCSEYRFTLWKMERKRCHSPWQNRVADRTSTTVPFATNVKLGQRRTHLSVLRFPHGAD